MPPKKGFFKPLKKLVGDKPKKAEKSKPRAHSQYDVFEADEADRIKAEKTLDEVEKYEYELPEDFEDEDIDEDAAFDDEDEMQFGSVFANLNQAAPGGGNKKKGKKKVSEFENDEEENDSELEGADYVDLSDILDEASDTADEEDEVTVVKGDQKAPSKPAPSSEKSKPKAAPKKSVKKEESDESDLGEADLEGGSDSDEGAHDELMSFLRSQIASAGNISDSSEEDGEREGEESSDEETGHAQIDEEDDLGEAVNEQDLAEHSGKRKKSDGESDRKKKRKVEIPTVKEVPTSRAESEFNILDGTATKDEVDLLDLVGGLKDTTQFGSFKDQLMRFAGDQAPTAVPMSNFEKGKLTRAVAYDTAKKEVSKWTPAVKSIREADQVKFPLRQEEPISLSSASLASNYKSETALDSQIEQILRECGVDQQKISEFEASKFREIAGEEKRAKTKEEKLAEAAEKAKIRAFLFFQEQKNRRRNNIKSKTYRKLLKKDKEKRESKLEEAAKDLDPEWAKEDGADDEKKRIMERMSLRHKNTSKWVKHALKHGADTETRQSVGEQLLLGQSMRLPEKLEDSEEEDNTVQRGVGREAVLAKLQSLTKAKNGGAESSGDEEDKRDVNAKAKKMLKMLHAGQVPEKGILSMKFMVRAEEEKRKKAAADVQFEEDFEDDLAKEPVAEQAPAPRVKKPLGVAPGLSTRMSAPMDVHVGAAPASATSSLFAVGEFPSTFGTEQDSNSEEEKEDKKKSEAPKESKKKDKKQKKQDNKKSEETQPEVETKPAAAAAAVTTTTKKGKKSKEEKTEETVQKEEEGEKASNPWLKRTRVAEDSSEVNPNLVLPTSANKATPDDSQPRRKRQRKGDKSKEGDADSKKPKQQEQKGVIGAAGVNKDQQAIIRMAFASDNFENQFSSKKKGLIEKDLPKSDVVELPGWGSWGGSGAPKARTPAFIKKAREEAEEKAKEYREKREDAKTKNAIIDVKQTEAQKKYMTQFLPHQFRGNVALYEKSLQTPLGPDWNTSRMHNKLVAPRIVTKTGSIIEPIQEKPKQNDEE